MKKIFGGIAAVLLAGSATAQNFNKGDWFLGAGSTELGLNHSWGKRTFQNSTTFNLQGTGGWFFADKFAVDASAGLSYVRVGEKGRLGYLSETNFVFGAGVRYYPVGNLFGRLGFRGETGTNLYALSLDVGYDFFITDKFYFEPAVYYYKNLTESYSGGRQNGVGLSLGFGVRF